MSLALSQEECIKNRLVVRTPTVGRERLFTWKEKDLEFSEQ